MRTAVQRTRWVWQGNCFSSPPSPEQTSQKLLPRATYPIFIFCSPLHSYLSVISGNWKQLGVVFLSFGNDSAPKHRDAVRGGCSLGDRIPGGWIPMGWAGLAHPSTPAWQQGTHGQLGKHQASGTSPMGRAQDGGNMACQGQPGSVGSWQGRYPTASQRMTSLGRLK